MAASSSLFLQKLTPEIRIAIYGFVFGTSEVIKPSSSDTALGMHQKPFDSVKSSHAPPAEEVLLHTSILTTCKTVFLEAIPILYAEHTIRGSTGDFRLLLQNADFAKLVRSVEIADCVGSYRDEHFHSVLQRLQILPQVRSLAILSDCLALLVVKTAGTRRHLTVVEFARMAQLGKVTCTDIGRYKLHGRFGRFTFVNRRITKMWPEVRTTSSDYDVWKDIDAVTSKWRLERTSDADTNFIAWATQTSLRLWVGMHDLLLRTASSGRLIELNGTPSGRRMLQYLRYYAKTTKPFCYNSTDLFEGVLDSSTLNRWLLRNLGTEDDHDTLLWATEYLALNIATHSGFRIQLGRQSWESMESSWAEVDGSLATIEYHWMLQNSARDGATTSLYFLHPFDKTNTMGRDSACSWLEHESELLEGILTAEQRGNYSGFSISELKQLTCLCMALSSNGINVIGDAALVDRYDKWSAGLLKRYLCAKGAFRYYDLLHVRVSDLRRVVRVVLSVLASQEERRRCQIPDHVSTLPPRGFDGEVFHPFAGQYGSLLERAWREYMATPGAGSMDLG